MEEVRAPIEYKQECLVESPRPTRPKIRSRKNNPMDETQIAETILNDDMERILMESQMEYLRLMKEQEELEQERRREIFGKFTNIRNQLKRIGKYDKPIQEVYELMIPMIDQYCENSTSPILLDLETYNMIFRNLKTIRLHKDDMELIHEMIRF